VREIKEVGLEPAAVSEAELKLADQLIDQLSAKRFDPNEYQDEFKARVETAIQRKIAGKDVSLAEAPVAKTGGNVRIRRTSMTTRGTSAEYVDYPVKAR
jgi:DNA end-binding protein Ku